MRLVVLGPGHPFRGGIPRTTTALVEALRARGHATTFLAAARQYPTWLYPGADDRDPDACPPVAGADRLLDPLAPWSWRRSRLRALAAGAEAWVLPYWTWAWCGLWLALLAGRRPPAVAVVHNPADHGAGPLRRAAATLVLRRCQGLFTHAESLARMLSAAHPGVPVASHPLAVTAPAACPDRQAAKAALALPRDRPVALFLGLIRPYKGVDLLLEAAAALPAASPWYVVVAGEPWGGLGAALERQAQRLGLGARVRLDLRWVPEAEVDALLGAADLVVLPYRSGSQSAVAPLALAHGVPVLATAVGGLPEVVEHGRNGLLVPPGSAAALAAALTGLEPAVLAPLAAGARAAAARLTWDAYAAAVEDLLGQVVARGGGSSPQA